MFSILFWILSAIIIVAIFVFLFCVFFDQALFNRPGTFFRGKKTAKKICITFDDGPSPYWTPKVLDELKKEGVKATFFLVGHHVQKYPQIAKRVADEGHEIANHGYAHSVVLYYTPAEIEEEIKYSELVIRQATGVTTKYYRPPKAWSTNNIKQKIRSMGYMIILWSLNSKDWVPFHHKFMYYYLSLKAQAGDIILFHDSGNVFTTEGGNREQTVRVLSPLIRKLKSKGFHFVTIEEMVNDDK